MKTSYVFSRTLKTVLPISLLFSVSAGVAQDVDSSVIVSAGAVNYYFNDDKAQQDDLGYQLDLEVPFNNRWALNLKYLDVNSKVTGSSLETDLDYVHAGAIYNFARYGALQAYAGAGFGDLTLNRPSSQKINRSAFDLSIGAKYFFSNNWLGRLEAIMIEPSGPLDHDVALSLSLGMAFGNRPSRVSTPELSQEVNTAPLDTDGDGVLDRDDDCPNTNPSLAVDSVGCVILDEDQRRQDLLVQFDFDQALVKEEFQDEIEAFAAFMRLYNETTALIEGHTDSTGPDAYNQNLSERRARAVRDELVNRYGIDTSRLSIVGFGESRPVTTNDTRLGRQQNRRIEADVSVQIMIERQR